MCGHADLRKSYIILNNHIYNPTLVIHNVILVIYNLILVLEKKTWQKTQVDTLIS